VSTTAAGVSGTCEFGIELGENSFEYELHILVNSAHRRTVNGDALSLEFHKGARANPSHRNCVNLTAPEGLQGLAHAVSVLHVAVFDFFDLS
jgi:hypothetical protein